MPPAPSSPMTMIHTIATLVPQFTGLVEARMPGWAPTSIVDESLLRRTIAEGRLTTMTMRRCLTHVWSAVDGGAEAIVVTCSSLGPAVEAARPFCPVPLFRIDEGMAVAAVGAGRRIGVLATLHTTLEPTTELIRNTAARAGLDGRQVIPRVSEGAFQKLLAGDTPGHDAMVGDSILALSREVDVIVLAQASMARALATVEGALGGCPVLTSPELGINYVRDRLAA